MELGAKVPSRYKNNNRVIDALHDLQVGVLLENCIQHIVQKVEKPLFIQKLGLLLELFPAFFIDHVKPMVGSGHLARVYNAGQVRIDGVIVQVLQQIPSGVFRVFGRRQGIAPLFDLFSVTILKFRYNFSDNRQV